MHKASLSLIGLKDLNHEFLVSLQKMGGLSIDLVPSHFMDTNSNDLTLDMHKLKVISDSGIQINSIQGLLFGFQPGEFSTNQFGARIEILITAASLLNVKFFVLGAPKIRSFPEDWSTVLQTFASKLAVTDIELGVENICTSTCTGTPFGGIPLSEYGFLKVIDVANALECDAKCYINWDKAHLFAYAHLADLGHAVPKSKDSYDKIWGLATDFGVANNFSWEFNLKSEEEFIRALGTLRDFSSEQLGDYSPLRG